MLFGAEQVAVGRSDIGADQDGAAGLEDLVVGADADGGEVLLSVVTAGRGDGLVQDVMDRSPGTTDSRRGRRSSSTTPRKELWQIRMRPRTNCRSQGLVTGSQKRSCGRRSGGGVKALVEGVVGLGELLVDELAADVVVVGELGDRSGAG